MRALFLLPLLTVGACAQDLRWGLHALGSTSGKELASLTGDATGFGLGFHAFITDGRSEALRVRVEGQTFPGGDEGGVKARVTETALWADWLHYFSGRPEFGPYTVLGLGGGRWHTQFEGVAPPPSENRTGALVAGGLGWQLDRTFGLEAQGWWSSRFRAGQAQASGVAAVLTVRF